jgi:hypothetical protein
VQVDPIKPTLKVPGTKRLKLKYDEPILSFAFNLSLRRYTEVRADGQVAVDMGEARSLIKKQLTNIDRHRFG